MRPAPLRRSQLRDINRPQHRRPSDSQTADQARYHQRVPVPGEGTADRRNRIQDGHDPQRLAAADLLAQYTRTHRADHRPHQPDKHCQAQRLWRQRKDLRQLLRRSRDHCRIKSEQKTAQRPDGSSLHQITIQGSFSKYFAEVRYESETLHGGRQNRQHECIFVVSSLITYVVSLFIEIGVIFHAVSLVAFPVATALTSGAVVSA